MTDEARKAIDAWKAKGNNPVPFRELAIGETFRHASEWDSMFIGCKTGLCRKTSPRKYCYVDDDMECQVGRITCEVIRSED